MKISQQFDFYYCQTIQVGPSDLYCYEEENNLWWLYKNVATNLTKELKATVPLQPITLVNQVDQYVYALGCFDDEGELLPTCLRYQVQQDVWHQGAVSDLSYARRYHSACAMGKSSIYVYGGVNASYEMLNSVEVLQEFNWSVLVVAGESGVLPKLQNSIMFSRPEENELVILGGQ